MVPPHHSNSDLTMANELQNGQIGGALPCLGREVRSRANVRQVQERTFHPARDTSAKHNGAAFAKRGINAHEQKISPTHAPGSALTRTGRRSAGRACREHVNHGSRRGGTMAPSQTHPTARAPHQTHSAARNTHATGRLGDTARRPRVWECVGAMASTQGGTAREGVGEGRQRIAATNARATHGTQLPAVVHAHYTY